MNYLLANEEAECGLNPNSEDLDAEEDDGVSRPNLYFILANLIQELERRIWDENGEKASWLRKEYIFKRKSKNWNY